METGTTLSSLEQKFSKLFYDDYYVHKRVSAGFLALYQAYYNLRTRRGGRHKDTNAHQALTGAAGDDWLTLLGFPPSQTVH